MTSSEQLKVEVFFAIATPAYMLRTVKRQWQKKQASSFVRHQKHPCPICGNDLFEKPCACLWPQREEPRP